MPIEVQCGGCGKRYGVAEQFAGKKAKCKACGGTMIVPQPAAASPAEEMDFDALAAMESSAPIALAPPPLPAAVAAPAARAPMPVAPFVPRKPGSSGFRLGFRLNRLVVIMLVIGGMLIVFGFKELSLASVSAATPQQLNCQQLERNGYGNNAFVHLTGFKMTGRFVYKPRNHSSSDWELVWVPIVAENVLNLPPEQILATVGTIKVIIKSNRLHSQSDVENFARQTSVEGMIINKIESLSSEEINLLRQSYPMTNFSTCYILEEGREPAGTGKYLAFFGGGGALLLLGLAFMLKPE